MTAIVLVSDTHAGSKVGLMNPRVKLTDTKPTGELCTYTPEPTETQKYLWEIYVSGLKKAWGIGKEQIDSIHNGDVAHGNRHPDQLVSTRPDDHLVIAVYNLHPLAKMSDHMTLSAGTDAHEFGESSATLRVADMLQAAFPKKEIKPVWHGFINAAGVTIDAAHHGPHAGSREWLKGNVARLYLKDMMIQEVAAGQVPPMVVVRSHVHIPVVETVRHAGYTSTIIITPPLCFLTNYARMRARSPHRVAVGMVILEIDNGKLLDIHEHIDVLDIRTRQEWTSKDAN